MIYRKHYMRSCKEAIDDEDKRYLNLFHPDEEQWHCPNCQRRSVGTQCWYCKKELDPSELVR